MRELPDQHLDADIARTLKFDTIVTPLQQQTARERLLCRAVEQTLLPSFEMAREDGMLREGATLRDHASTIGQQTKRLFNFLVLDSGVYERARRLPHLYPHYNPHGRYAFTIIHMSA